MAEGIRIDDLTPTVIPGLLHEFPAMKDGLTVKLTLAQVQQLMLIGDGNAALALKDLSNTVGPRGKFSPSVTADYDSLLENGTWTVNPGGANAPEAINYYRVRTECDSNGGWATQYAVGFGTDTTTDSFAFKRERNAGVWGSWYRVRENEAELDLLYARREVGQPVLTFSKTAPFRCLKANGAAVSNTTYADLDAAIYCGNADNSTADWGYRCTNPANPTGSRSVSGGYTVLPDCRGEFLRGWDDGRGVDADRSFWAAQSDAIKSHNHPVTDLGHVHQLAGGPNAPGTGTVAPAAQSGNPGLVGGMNTATTGITIQNTGGTETRPRNISPLVYIRY